MVPLDYSCEYRKLLSVALLRRWLRLGQALHSKPPVSRGCASDGKMTQVVCANGDSLRACNFKVAHGAARAWHAVRTAQPRHSLSWQEIEIVRRTWLYHGFWTLHS